MYAGLPSTVALTPSIWVGRLEPTKSARVQMRVVPARLVPLMVIQEPCVKPGRKLAPFRTAEMVGGGAALTVKVTLARLLVSAKAVAVTVTLVAVVTPTGAI